MVGWRKVRIAGMLVLGLLPGVVWAVPAQKKQNPDRPTLPYRMLGPRRDDVDAYDSKAEPVARVTEALIKVNQTGWELIRRYYRTLGTSPEGAEKRVHPDDPADRRFYASFANEDPSFSPIPLLCMIWSLPESQLSGPLKDLHNELVPALALEDYSAWKLDELRKAVDNLTDATATRKGVKYRTPKRHLSFKQALQVYAMTLALVRMETKWADKADLPVPDMVDFTNRLSHQLPRQISDGETAALFLYLPASIDEPLARGEFEERADVVVIKRKGTAFDTEQFPVFLTVDQKEWNPSWIEPADVISDTSLVARKYQHDWTRLDGPYLWFRPDQLNGEVVYRATVKFQASEIVIEAERSIARRGAVKRASRPADYDPAKMTAFDSTMDAAAEPFDPLSVEAAGTVEQFNSLKWPTPFFSNAFRAWCAHGRWTTGPTDGGKTWVFVDADKPRKGVPTSNPSPAGAPQAATQSSPSQ